MDPYVSQSMIDLAGKRTKSEYWKEKYRREKLRNDEMSRALRTADDAIGWAAFALGVICFCLGLALGLIL